MQQVLFYIPIKTSWFPHGIPIFGFGLMLFLAFFLCTWLAGRRAEREGVAKEDMQDLALWLFLGGLLGARIVFLLVEVKETNLLNFLYQLPRIWDGGIVLYGSILGGLAAFAIVYYVSLKFKGLRVLQITDIVSPSIAVGICLGRIGCLLNGCCYGQVACTECAAVRPVQFPVSAPPRYALVENGWQTVAGFTLDPRQPEEGVRVGQVEPNSPAAQAGLEDGDIITAAEGRTVEKPADLAQVFSYRNWPPGKKDLTLTVQRGTSLTYRPQTIGLQPTQLYESISMALLFLLLSAYYPLRTREGQVTALLMVCYGVHRFLNEQLRGDPRPEGFEWVGSVIAILGGLALAAWLQTRPAPFATPGKSLPTPAQA